MVRNAVDHGVETPEERQQAGKDPMGTVTLSAERKGGNFEICLQDDGKGLDPEKLIAIAMKKGVLKTGEGISRKQAYDLIFAGGFSTVAQATEISGRRLWTRSSGWLLRRGRRQSAVERIQECR